MFCAGVTGAPRCKSSDEDDVLDLKEDRLLLLEDRRIIEAGMVPGLQVQLHETCRLRLVAFSHAACGPAQVC